MLAVSSSPQIAPCSSFVGVGPCQECWPNKTVSHQSCRFVEYRRLRVAEILEESVRWEVVGFASEDDVKLEHLAPWIPLKTGGWVGNAYWRVC